MNRAFIISDIHFGLRSNSKFWQNNLTDYFENFFIPFIQKNKKDGDFVLCLGDVFDNRQSIHLPVLNQAQLIFKKISEILPIHCILGNHDLYKNNSIDINSVSIFENYNNITIYKEPTVMNFGKYKSLLLPWITDEEEIMNVLEKDSSDFLFAHFSVKLMKYNSKIPIDNGIPIEELNKYKKVFSGHIHYRQEFENVIMVGNPLHTKGSDYKNKKGIYVINFEDGNIEFHENNYSPEYINVNIKNLDITDSILNRNLIRLYIPNDYILSEEDNKNIKELSNISLTYDIIYYNEESDTSTNQFKATEDFDVFNNIIEYIEKSAYAEELTVSLKDKLNLIKEEI